MDIHTVIMTAVEELRHGVEEARKGLVGKATIDFPTKLEIEFGIATNYEVANFDDAQVAKVRATIPIFQDKETVTVAPATAALEEEKKNGKKEHHEKKKKA